MPRREPQNPPCPQRPLGRHRLRLPARRVAAVAAAVLAATVLGATDAGAVETHWITSGSAPGFYSWGNPANWDNGVPADSFDALIGIALAYVTYAEPAVPQVLNSLVIDSVPYAGPPGDPNNGRFANLLHFGGSLQTGSLIVGDVGRAQIAHYSGEILAGQMTVGRSGPNPSPSSIWMAGDAKLVAGSLTVGEAGSAVFFHTGANQVTVNGPLTLGAAPGGWGNYQMHSLDPASQLTVVGQFTVGSGGIGSFSQQAGLVDNTANALYLGEYAGGNGFYTMSGGELMTAGIGVGEWGGAGEFQQFGGEVTVTHDIGIARQNAPVASAGAWRIVAGKVTAASIQVGINGNGEFWHYGGRVETTGDLRIATGDGVGSGIYRMVVDDAWGGVDPLLEVDGALTVGEGRAGSFVQTLGTVNVTASVVLGLWRRGIGDYRIEGGSLTARNLHVGEQGRGEFVQTGGKVEVGDDLMLGLNPPALGQAAGWGRYSLEGGVLVTGSTSIGRHGTGVFDQSGGTHEALGEINVGFGGNGEMNLSGGTVKAGHGIFVYGPAAGPGAGGGSGVLRYSGGTIDTSVSNYGRVELSGAGQRTISGEVTNAGQWWVNTTDVRYLFSGYFFNHGEYRSTGSNNHFSNLYVDVNGYLAGDAGSRFVIDWELLSYSEQSWLWDTRNAQLVFTGPGAHPLWLNGADYGRQWAGYDQNFAWGDLQLEAGAGLELVDGNAELGAALYVGTISGLQIVGGTVANIQGHGFNIYYAPAANPGLHGLTYALEGGGTLAPVPEPQAWLMLAGGLAALGWARHRQRAC